tara:strand:+ start:112 stop:606 length:495 start_codon:yes stop_codon:yes gene_type:complete
MSGVEDQYKTIEEALRHHVDQLDVKMAAVPNYLKEHAPLKITSAENYFYLSTFYKEPSLNALVKGGEYDWRTVQQNFRGVEYTTTKVEGRDLFIIQKQFRKSKHETTLIAIYYILHGEIYQSPSIFDVVSARLLNCNALINQAFDNFVAEEEKSILKNKKHNVK